MLYRLNPDGSVDVPMRAEGPDGTTAIGDGYRRVYRGDPGYAEAVENARHDMVIAQRWPTPPPLVEPES